MADYVELLFAFAGTSFVGTSSVALSEQSSPRIRIRVTAAWDDIGAKLPKVGCENVKRNPSGIAAYT